MTSRHSDFVYHMVIYAVHSQRKKASLALQFNFVIFLSKTISLKAGIHTKAEINVKFYIITTRQ